MTEVSTRQFILIAIFLIVASKMMTMPTLIFEFAVKESVYSIILGFIVEILIVFLICEVIKRNPNISLFDLLKKKFSIVGAYFIMIILYVFVLFKLLFVLQELYSFFKEFLYDDFHPLIYAIPTFFVIGYLAYKGARTLGRTLEILFLFVVIGIVVSIVSNLEFVTANRMLPYFENGVTPMLEGIARNMFFFGNSIPLLFFVGKVKINHLFTTKTFSATTGLAVFITAFCFIFYDVYGYATYYTLFALSDFTQYDPFILDLQRLNWLSTFVDVTKLFCTGSILLYCLGQAGKSIAQVKSSFFPIIFGIIATFVVATLSKYDLDTMKTYITEWVSFATMALMVLIILICIIMCIKRSSKNEHQ